MFTDDHSRMRWGVSIKTEDATAEALHALVQEVADPAGLCIGKIQCDGGAEFEGRFQELCVSLGIIIETNLGTIMGTTRRLLLGTPHLPGRLWAEAFKAAIYIKNRTPSDVLDGKALLEVWEGKKLGNLLHMYEWGALAFKRVEARFRSKKLAARAKKRIW